MASFSLVILTSTIVICCRRQSRLLVLKMGKQIPRAPPLKTAVQDATGIIQPDVMFFAGGIHESNAAKPGAMAALIPATLVGAAVQGLTFSPEAPILTPLKPLSPAYQASQPIQLKTSRYLGTLSEELALPPGYLQQRLKIQSQMTPVHSS
ncbi:uncharacterized protein LOC114828076 [Galendromus occidentalis]|uniref:Uncharacterized protein LOC114828076 n=1 Tax=Galendromus occidentalis TaxID=34638 RepID=A0AAJ7WGZ2_9ACAR|nr:uncharacterized protein LOC114828076 [Galendromus occidentalis]